MPRDAADEAIQPVQPLYGNWRTVWQVHATTKGRIGDLIFVLLAGTSHSMCGPRNDTHDALGIEVAVRVQSQTEAAPNRTRTDIDPEPTRNDDNARQPGDAPQLARDDDNACQPGYDPQHV